MAATVSCDTFPTGSFAHAQLNLMLSNTEKLLKIT
jgi:hypothetical protein